MPYIVYSTTLGAPIARWDGRLIDLALRDGEVAIACPPSADPNAPAWADAAAAYDAEHALANARTLAVERIDQAASDARGRHITAGVGQEATYQMKEREADAYVAAGRPADGSAWLLLSAEAQATESTVSDVADMVRSMRDQWMQLAAYIEGVRMGAKRGVQASENVADILATAASAQLQLEAV